MVTTLADVLFCPQSRIVQKFLLGLLKFNSLMTDCTKYPIEKIYFPNNHQKVESNSNYAKDLNCLVLHPAGYY